MGFLMRARMIVVFATLIVATTVLVGCNSDTSLNQPTTSGESLDLVSDPLDGVMNSTLGFTPPNLSDRIARLAEALDLSPEQTEDLLEAYTVFRTGIDELRELVQVGELSIEDAKAQAVVLREAFEAELQVILTPEQYELLQDMRQSRDRTRDRSGDEGDCWTQWLEEIGASEEQITDVMAALETLKLGMKDLHIQVREGEISMEEAKEAALVLRADFEAALESILGDLYSALEDLRPDRCNK